MLNLLDLAMLIAGGAALMGPLLYGLATLRGMKRKVFFPLLRFKSRDGTLLIMKVENGPVNHSV